MQKRMKNVAVIGSGFGGLAAAIRLQSSGMNVTVFEKRALPGGRAYVYEQDGFTFDAGPTVITAPDCLRELFELSDRKMEDYIELTRLSPMYRLYWEDGVRFNYTDDVEDTIRQIRKLSPVDADRYPEFLEYTRQVFVEGYEKLAHVPFQNIWSMVKVSPQLMKLQAFRTVYGMVSKYIKDPHLRQAFSFHSLLVGGNPFAASSIYTLIHYLEKKWGVYFAKGGTGAMVRALVKLFEDNGGTLRCGAEVRQIVTENGEVTGLATDQGFEAFDAVISNGDVVHTYRDLLKEEPRAARPAKSLQKSRHSMSLFVVYFGTKKRYPEFAHHNILFGHRYRELLEDIFDRRVLADDFSLYLHVPTKTDPSLAPEGYENFYVLSPVPHLGNGDIDWNLEGPKYADRILSYLERHYMPGLRQEIVTQRTLTPLDFKYELNSHVGSAFSLEPVLTQSAYFRVHNRDHHIQGLYFVGAGTHPGAGIPGVVSSAKATAGLVLEDVHERNLSIVNEFIQEQKQSKAPLPLSTSPSTSSARLEESLAQCREMITVGSKSFSLASKFFSAETRDAAWFLYGWCRYCDDAVDGLRDPALQKEKVRELRAQTLAAFNGEPVSGPVFVAMKHIAAKYSIPSHYALELIEGMEMDTTKALYPDMRSLSLYCYRVAGCVGLMMSHVMGLSDSRALPHAGDMGSAMQLTNIARDVLEDAQMGRVYLPLDWLAEEGVHAEDIAKLENRGKVYRVVQRVVRFAEKYYRSGNYGLRFLPFRSAFTVAIASCVYREIGKIILRSGPSILDRRAVVSKPRKLWMVVKGMAVALGTIPYRMRHPWRRSAIDTVWRHA